MTLLRQIVFRACGDRGRLLNFRHSHVPLHRIQRISRIRANHQPTSQHTSRHLIKPLIFTVCACNVFSTGAIIWRYENTIQLKGEALRKKLQSQFKRLRQIKLDNSPLGRLRRWYNNQNDSFHVFLALFALNALVFFAWRVPSLQPTMMKYFVTSCETNRIRLLPMILSNFSHNSGIHFGLNMFVLYSFSNLSINTIGKENFIALYMCSGVVSSFTSYVYKVFVGGLAPSLGASGAILGILASCCVERPDIQLMIVFLPFFSFSSAAALKAIIALDFLGCIFRLRFFDHAAHLGGSLYGMYYSKELKEFFASKQNAIIDVWKKTKKLI